MMKNDNFFDKNKKSNNFFKKKCYLKNVLKNIKNSKDKMFLMTQKQMFKSE